MDLHKDNKFELIENNGKSVPVVIYPERVIKKLKTRVKEAKKINKKWRNSYL